MIAANVTVANVALPWAQADLRLTSASLAWVINAYLVAAGGVLLLGGRLGDLFGRRRVFGWGTALFAAASLGAGAAPDAPTLVASRFGQGLGVALAAPAALSLVLVAFPAGPDRTRALAVWAASAPLGAVAGLLLSAVLTEVVGWRWVFLINLPVAIVALAFHRWLVNESHAPGGRLDLAGAVLVTSGLVAVVAGLLAASSRSWGDPRVLGPLLGGAAVLAAFVLVERAAADPILPLPFYADTARSVAALAMTLMTGAMAAMFLLLTLYLSTVRGSTPLSIGVAYLPFSAMLAFALMASTRLIIHYGHWVTACVAFALTATGLLLLSWVLADDSTAMDLVPATLVLAAGLGTGLPALQGAVLRSSTAENAGLAAGVVAGLQQLGAAVGLAVLTTLASRRAASALSEGIHDHAAAVVGYRFAFQTAGLVLTATTVLVLLVTNHTARQARSRIAAPGAACRPGVP